VVSKRHLSEVSRPSGDIIGWSPVHPFGFSRVYLTRHLPPASFLSSSTACASADSPALFHAGAAHGVSRTRPSPVRRGWRREMRRSGRSRAQWQCCRSSTAMPGDQRWSVDRSRTSDWNRSRNRASAGRVQTGTLTLDHSTDSIHPGGSSPGSSDAEACAPSGDPVSNAAPKRAFDSVRPAAPATEVAASANQRSPPVTNPPCRTVRKPPAPRSTPTFAGLRVQGNLPGKHGVESTLPTRDQRLDSPANGVVETARPTRGTAEAITTRRPYSLASEQEQRVRPSTTSPDCE
jgi:hypothetical protein